MKRKLLNVCFLTTSILLSGCGSNQASKIKVKSDTLYVAKVENLKEDFIMGMDASSVLAQEASGVKYYNFNGEEADVFKTLSENGINYIRVRVWNDPFDKNGNGYGGGNCNIDTAVEIGKRATKYGMKLLVDFHYSDFWADPGKQMAPKAWKNMDIETKADALYQYTKDCMNKLNDAGVDVGMVQIGNETNGAMCGETKWRNIVYNLMAAGSRAIRETNPKALIAVHFANPEKTDNYLNYASKLKYYNLDYDVFGSSYYPYWHGTLENLSSILSEISTTYNKKVMVMETSYAYTTEELDGWGNTIGTGGYDVKAYPFTIAGQANCVRDVIDTIANKTTNGIGVCYWEGTWNSIGPANSEENSPLWEKYGSGWATSYAKEYDPNDAGKYYGGSAVDNQAFFDSQGKPIESLKVFALVRKGNIVPTYVDGVEDATEIFYTDNANYKLPEKINVVFSDNSKRECPVTWQAFDLDAARKKGNARYVIEGEAEGYKVYCNLQVMEYNYAENYSFEDGDKYWQRTINTGTLSDSHKITITNENPQTGKNAYHFWTSDSTGVNFDLEQKLVPLNPGIYKYQLSILGGGKGTSAITESAQNNYMYVKINGEIVKKESIIIKSYSDGYNDYIINDIICNSGDEVTIGIHIEISEANCWGDIDDTMFNFVSDVK